MKILSFKAILFLFLCFFLYFFFSKGYFQNIIYKVKITSSNYLFSNLNEKEKFDLSIQCLPKLSQDLLKKSSLNDSYKFIIAGHTYGDSRIENNIGLYPKFYKNLKSIKDINEIDFILLNGDVVQNSSTKSWNIILNQLEDIGIKAFIAPGNHDVGNGNNPKRDIFEKLIGKTYYSFYHKNDLFIVLDPNIDNGNITGNQLNFLIDLLENKKKVKNIFIFSHQVIWQSEFIYRIKPNNIYENITNYRSSISPLLEQQEENIFIIAGDVGDKANGSEIFCADKNKIKYIASGMGAGQRDNYLLVDVYSGDVSITPKLLN